ncbi:MAG: serine--tRNA ligase [Bacteroidetes bacterium]|nr:MAG: serine--tRNA ligase [Bacteroidota bacterium]
MLKLIRENAAQVRQNIINKNEKTNIDEILTLDEKRRFIIGEVDKLKNLRNTVSAEIAKLKKEKIDAEEKIAAMKDVSDKIKSLDDELRSIEEILDELVLFVPNIAHESVPVGRTAEDNVVVRSWGEQKKQKVKKDHVEIAKEFGLIDFERGAKVSGSGFYFYTGKGAALERAIINFMLDFHVNKHGYTEVYSPFIVNANSMHGTGQIPKLAEDMYLVEKEELYLIPTAEVPLTNYYANEILGVEQLPTKFCGFSPCFRREAGSYGKETRGLQRVHQFNKVELVKFVEPEKSYGELESLVNDVEEVLQQLNIPYRVLLLCTGDTSFSSAKTYDIEVWSPADEKWLEVSSCSNFESFQARRAGIKYKPSPNSKPEFVHTLNGSGVATPRLMISLLENNIDENGNIIIPDVLKSFLNFSII